MLRSNIRPSFHLWLKEILVKHQNVSKYYEKGCLQNFILLFTSSLTAKFVDPVLFGLKITYVSKKGTKTNLKFF